MRHIKLENSVPRDYSIEQLFLDYPDAVIYTQSQMPNETLLANYGVYPLVTEAKPTIDETEAVEESTPEFMGGEWHQTWRVRKLTEIEIQALINADVAKANGNAVFATSDIQAQRYEICKTCPSFTALKTCKECGCIMPLKTKLANTSCPLAKW
jgi:hypothetical protein